MYYPDMVKVKVCETKGKVVGFDAVAFLKNHRTRAAVNTKISLGEAQAKLNKNLSVEASRLTVIPVEGKETAAYELLCDYKGDTYFIYVGRIRAMKCVFSTCSIPSRDDILL